MGRRLAVTSVLLAISAGFVAPGRADAHGVGGVQPTNYATTVSPDTPGIPEVRVEIIDLGERVQLTNRGSQTITVVGYQDEPYLRVGPDGVFENLRSPATYINRTLVPTGSPPASADPAAPPEWRKISDEPVARWHDHRAHWMGPTPQVVRDDPGVARQLTDWSIPLLVNGAPGAEATGTIAWEPSSSAWPWVIGALVLAAAIAVLSRLTVWRAVWLIALVGIAIGALVIVSGAWQFSTAGLAKQFFANVYNLAALTLAVVAAWFVVRKERRDVAPLVLLAGLVALFGTGLPGFDDLSAPFIPTSFPVVVARAAVATAIGLGLGLTIGAAMYLKVTGPARRHPVTAQQVPDSTVENSTP